MAVVTLYRLAEEILKALSGGNIQGASNISLNEIKISIGQVCNQLLKAEQFSINEKMGETIPNGTVVATYEDIVPTSWVTGKSKATLPIKPLKFRRNMGVWNIFFTDDPDHPFIPVQMGQFALMQSQTEIISTLLGQIGYENKGMELQFNKDLPLLYPNKTLSLELLIMDVSQYDDYTPLPVLPEQEWTIKQEVIKLYSGVGVADLIVDPSNKQLQGIPLNQQKQAP